MKISYIVQIFYILRKILTNRIQGKLLQQDISANLQKLTDLEKGIIVQYILDLDLQAFLLQKSSIEDIANRILAD